MTTNALSINSEELYNRPLSQWDPITTNEIKQALIENSDFLEHVARLGELGSISVMRMPSSSVSDSTLLLTVKEPRSEPLGILHISQICDPGQVRRSFLQAKAIADKLGSPLNRRVLLPLWVGDVAGRSCSFTQLKKPTASGWLWGYQKRRMQKPVLEWLFASAQATIVRADGAKEAEVFVQNLDYFDGKVGFSKAFNKAVASAKTALLKGDWVPCHMVDHNDLWKGNVILENEFSQFDRFYTIDWAASNVEGYGIHDFVTFSKSFGVSHARMKRWLQRYAELLDGNLDAVMYQYLAGMGHLGRHLNNFPYDRYVQKASYEFAVLRRLLERP